MSIRSSIMSQFKLVAKEQKRELLPLTDDLVLFQSGLDSLSFAVIVSRLEDELGVDPFTVAESDEFPTTLGDFIRIYENAVEANGRSASGMGEARS